MINHVKYTSKQVLAPCSSLLCACGPRFLTRRFLRKPVLFHSLTNALGLKSCIGFPRDIGISNGLLCSGCVHSLLGVILRVSQNQMNVLATSPWRTQGPGCLHSKNAQIRPNHRTLNPRLDTKLGRLLGY